VDGERVHASAVERLLWTWNNGPENHSRTQSFIIGWCGWRNINV